MSSFTFAIASIVDANTGYGLGARRHPVVFDETTNHGREIRSRVVPDLPASIRAHISRLIERYRTSAAEKRDLTNLMRLNDHLLRDIGLNRGDLLAVEMGSLSLRELHRQRQTAHRFHLQEGDNSLQVGRIDFRAEAANAQRFEDQKCA